MAKEKNQNFIIKENERLFHYEIIGIVLLILSVLAITRMGLIGFYLMLFIKLLFGDWYFVVFFLIILYSIHCILFHNKLNISNIRYLGILLLFCSLMILSHFSMHKYVKEYNENSFLLTIKLYLNSFKNRSVDSIIGGGIIGGLLFNFSYYLLSEVGVILISMIFIFLGIVFISRLTIKEFFLKIFTFLKKSLYLFNKTKSKIKGKIDNYDLSYKKVRIKYKISKVNTDEYYNKELEFAKRNVETIKKVLNSMNVFYNDITFIICRNITVYFIQSYYKFSYDVFYHNLSNHLHNFLLKKDTTSNELIIEVNNLNSVPLRICEINDFKKNEVIFGMDDRNNYLKLDFNNPKMLIIGNNKSLLNDYLDTIILSLLYYKSKVKYYYINLVNNSTLQTSNSIDELDHLIDLINQRIKIFNQNNVSTIDEYNNLIYHHITQEINYELIVINGIDRLILDKNMYDKLIYILEISNKLGYYFILCANDIDNTKLDLYNLFDFHIFFDNHNELAKSVIKDVDFINLNKNTEAVLCYKAITIRYSLLLLTEYERANLN